MPPVVALTFTAALALVNLWLALRITLVRHALGVVTGDGGDARLVARMRAQANFAEYVPLCLILMALIELAGGARQPLWLLGAALVAGRLLHLLGMEGGGRSPARAVGIALTWLVTLILVGWALDRAWLVAELGRGGVVAIG